MKKKAKAMRVWISVDAGPDCVPLMWSKKPFFDHPIWTGGYYDEVKGLEVGVKRGECRAFQLVELPQKPSRK